ncbi:MAG: RDD family protein [Thermomicrobiales bacterium]
MGKQALGIRVVRAGTGQPITMESAVIRAAFWVVPFGLAGSSGEYGILGVIGSIWLVAGLISLIASPARQRLGDRVANTVVVRVGANQGAPTQFASPSRTMPAASPPSTIGTTGAPEAWLTCGYCGSRFPRSRARPGIWQGESVLFCPNCGGPVQRGNPRS